MAIQAEYHHSDLGFRCGIGLAHGRAVAGQIGTKDQVKVTAFGPVVNLSSRLESMSKRFGAEIILDEATRAGLLASEQQQFKLRRLAKVRPAGFASPVEISELIGDAAIGTHQVSDALIADYEAALDLFCANDLDAALKQFRSLPTWDGPTQMMIKQILSGDSDGEVIELPK